MLGAPASSSQAAFVLHAREDVFALQPGVAAKDALRVVASGEHLPGVVHGRAPLADILESLLVAPPYRRPFEPGPAIGVFAADYLLVLTVPQFAGKWFERRFGGAIVGPAHQRLSHDGTARVVVCRVRPHAAMRAAFPLGVLGEVRVEAG